MALLSDELKEQIRERFRSTLGEEVALKLYLKPGGSRLVLPDGVGCQTCADFRELAEGLSEMSEGKISLSVVENHEGEVPVLEVGRPGEEPRTSFRGLPAGYEFATLLDAVERISTGVADLSPETVEALDQLTSEVELMVFVTPTCPYCPRAASLANRLAMVSPRIRAATIEANEFPALSRRFSVQGVPQTVVNQSGVFVGALPESEFVASVLEHASAEIG